MELYKLRSKQFHSLWLIQWLKSSQFGHKLETSLKKDLKVSRWIFLSRNKVSNKLKPMILKKWLLFEKELTPSDVGKLNRLVKPKKYAVRYFPTVPHNDKSHGFAKNEANLTSWAVEE
ncbi:AP2/B3 transcription factor family protein [Artemisia annua]|uniref:AP2/B3 transcription factor family protein n=1 Tax=Artemisia annua TaxID=35608 RepID=A0A2U1PTB7_ARTAN|nr:AP2/B3 transcription factor family protein [Artemisia annua]